MSDVINSASAALDGWLKTELSRDVTYARGAATVVLAAAPGESQYEVDQEVETIREQTETRDYMITAADLILSAAVTLPEVNDRITDTDGVYEVRSPGPVPHYEFSDPSYRRMLRVHTRRIADV